ncbi:hypothetical protein HMI54_008882 [Coelomomyces lativittatus]|nr:hypothetical protein HMI55_003022 [Coelomomyces lativittatus]KAJ1502596.1 hypothetical protein HMI54_008882 [Coelomomyces lativittatus]KAJ1515266.1 hypothetical protein HMI56_006154 [Coelomomyces lativittatus]
MSGITSSEDIQIAYEDVRNDKTDTNWLYVTYVEGSDSLKLCSKGSGGLNEFLKELKDDQAGYGYIRMMVGNDSLSKRSKFVLVSWVGEQVKVMRKAKVSVHLADVKKVLSVYAIEVSANNLSDLKEENLILLLKKAMGANYDRQTSDY